MSGENDTLEGLLRAKVRSSAAAAALLHAALFCATGALLSIHLVGANAPIGGASALVVELGAGGLEGSTETRIPLGSESGERIAPSENTTEPPTTSTASTEANSHQEPSESREAQTVASNTPEVSAPKTNDAAVVDTVPPAPPVPSPSEGVLPTHAAAAEPLSGTAFAPLAEKTPTKSVEPPVQTESIARRKAKEKVPERESTQKNKDVAHKAPKSSIKPEPKRVAKVAQAKSKAQDAETERVLSTPAAAAAQNATAGANATTSSSSDGKTVLGTAAGDAETAGAATLPGSGEGLKKLALGAGDAALVDNGDGTYRPSGKGPLNYRILEDARPTYPRRARQVGLTKAVRVRVQFVVDERGEVISTRVLTKDVPPLDFEEEAERAIRTMRFEPIRLAGIPVKVTFVKTIVFRP